MLTRREFIKRCRDISLLMCGQTLLTRQLAHGFLQLAKAPPSIAFVHAQNCMGCTTSMMYGNDFDFLDFLGSVGNLDIHPALSFNQGGEYLARLDAICKEGNHLLVVEGSIPSDPPEACLLGDRPIYDVLADCAQKAKMVICSGSCASHGGIPASGGNQTGALSVGAYLEQKKIKVPLLQVPGCPVHPDHLMGSIAYITATGKLPPLKKETRLPEEYFGELLHNRCSRYQHFSQDKFVNNYAKDKNDCLLKKGCRGPVTASDCPVRRWNKRTSVCVESNTPCIGCMNSHWPFKSDLYLETAEVEDLPWSQMKQKTNSRR
ncbi:MAG: hyaluronate lyase [Desulfuromonas sp.]|nr:MAG: hyaluronate lyase [Desulfuromonas sp.]